jgi:hypothetical protein
MKKILLVSFTALILFGLSSCKFFDSLFYVAPPVSPRDLGSYSGSLPTTRDEALQTIGIAGMNTMMGAALHVANSPAWGSAFGNARVLKAFSSIPSFRLLAPLLDKLNVRMGAKSISLATTGFDGTTTDNEFHLDIENETVNLPALGASGSMVIDKCKADITATMTSTTMPFDVDGKGEVDAELHATNLVPPGTGQGKINSAIIGLKAKGTATVTNINSSAPPSSSTYDLSASLKAGFSVTAPAGTEHQSGKFIIETSYYDNGSLTEDQMNGPEDISNIKFTIKITVYDNDNKEVDSYTLDQDDLATYINGGLK